MISDFKKGIIRIMLGHTKSLGTGVDAPDKAVASHNLDIPWTPKDFEQRGGRAARKGNIVAKEHAGNKVDNFIYASENSLDTYKFNLLQNKQLFISQLKNNSLGVRTIDEGAMDEDGNIGYSEYVAILSGNTDLLDKVKLERKIAMLESELKSYNAQINRTEVKMNSTAFELERKLQRLENIKKDRDFINEHLPVNENGIRPNPIVLDNFKGNGTLETIGEKLIEIDKFTDTQGEFQKIGSLSRFNILVKTEAVSMTDLNLTVNRFFIEGACKYSYNNGDLAKDPLLAATNFIRALDKIPALITRYESEIPLLEKDIQAMKGIVTTPWRKEPELKQSRIELSALERKINNDLNKQDQYDKPVQSIPKNKNKNKEEPVEELIYARDIPRFPPKVNKKFHL